MKFLNRNTYRRAWKGGEFFSILLLIAAMVSIPAGAGAQFIVSTVEVDAEISATTIQNLEFDAAPVRTGKTSVKLGDPEMGVFRVQGYRYQQLILSLDTPTQLEHEHPDIEETVPVQLDYAYNNRGKNNSANVVKFHSGSTNVTLTGRRSAHRGSPRADHSQFEQARMYIYVYGSVDIGNVQPGIYKNEAIVRIEY